MSILGAAALRCVVIGQQALVVILAALAMATAAAGQTTAPAAAPPAGRADVGKTLFTKNGCFECHGSQAQGGTAGPRLGPRPIPFAAFVAYVRKPANDMPPYAPKVMSERDLADVYAFLQGLPQPAALSSIPLLRP
jgi:mono/diheme cytochrome c family protein